MKLLMNNLPMKVVFSNLNLSINIDVEEDSLKNFYYK